MGCQRQKASTTWLSAEALNPLTAGLRIARNIASVSRIDLPPAFRARTPIET